MTGFATALASAFGVSAASTGEALKAYNGLNNYGGLVAAGTAHNDNGFPKLFVNILLFDKNYVLIDAAWQQIDGGEQPVGNATKLPHDYLSAELTAREPGFAYVYFSNESATLVDGYFDDVTMTYTPCNILQYNEYYPFGLQTANSWTRENTTGNNFLFNGGTELNSTTGVYDLHYRNYDPVLGRMTQVDPVAGKYASLTPYNYAFNSPANLNDPLGDEPPFFNREAWRGNMRGGAVYPRGGRNGMDDADWGQQRWLGGYSGSVNWTLGGGWSPLTNGQAIEAGINYNNYFNSWAHTAFGSSVYSSTEFGGGTFMFDYNGANYGGNYHTENGQVTSIAFSSVIQAANGGWKPNGATEISVFGEYQNNIRVTSTSNPFADRGPWVMTGQGILGFSQFALETVVHSSSRPRYYGPKEWTNYKTNAGRLSTRLGLAGVVISAADGLLGKEGWQNHHTADVTIGLGLTGASWIASTATVAALIPGLNVAIAVVGLSYFAVDLGVQIFSKDHKSVTQKLFD